MISPHRRHTISSVNSEPFDMKPFTASRFLRSVPAIVATGGITILMTSACHADWKPSPDAAQHIYQAGVPHTDKNGRPLIKYDAQRSFLPLAIYHALEAPEEGYSLSDLKKGGFNTAFCYWSTPLAATTQAATQNDLQLVLWSGDAQTVKTMLNNPNMLGYNMDDEPIGSLGAGLEARFEDLQKRTREIKAVDKTHAVFHVDAGWILPPATSWWVKLNTSGDVSSHDNYPINSLNTSLSLAQGIPETVSLAVASNKEQKPMWFVAQNHEWVQPRFACTFPTTAQQRCMVYTSLIHGATGIVHFAYDSFVTREARVIGISPAPKAKHRIGVVATDSQLRQSRELWEATTALNAQLTQLRPVLLSPTAREPYTVELDDAWKPVTQTPIRTLLKVNPAGGYTLLLANVDGAPQRVRVRFAGKNYRLTELFNEPGANLLERKEDAFEFLTTPYDVRVFQIDLQ